MSGGSTRGVDEQAPLDWFRPLDYATLAQGPTFPATIALAKVMSRCAQAIIACASVSVVEIIP